MEPREHRRGMAWGVLMITFGLTALSDQLLTVTDWVKIAIMAGGGLIGLVFFLLDRKDLHLLIPPYILLAVAAIATLALTGVMQDETIATFVLALVAIPFLVVFVFNPRDNWWALIPAWVMLVIGLMIFLVERGVMADSFVAFYILSSIGLPFLIVFFTNPSDRWWALIPAYVMLDIGTMVVLIEQGIMRDLAIPAYVMLSMAAPFFVVYFVNRRNWWALIPGFITGMIGLGFVAGTDIAAYVIPVALILTGLGILTGAFKKRKV